MEPTLLNGMLLPQNFCCLLDILRAHFKSLQLPKDTRLLPLERPDRLLGRCQFLVLLRASLDQLYDVLTQPSVLMRQLCQNIYELNIRVILPGVSVHLDPIWLILLNETSLQE